MTLQEAIKIGNAIEKYNMNVEESQELEFYEVLGCMYDDTSESVQSTLEEIERRTLASSLIKDMHKLDIITNKEYNQFLKAL